MTISNDFLGMPDRQAVARFTSGLRLHRHGGVLPAAVQAASAACSSPGIQFTPNLIFNQQFFDSTLNRN